jgi:diaminopropionate ammonia-lyase
MAADIFYNSNVIRIFDGAPPGRTPLEFHRRLPGYAPTPLVDAPGLAARLGVAKVWVKDESSRLGLPAFKILGASWATYKALEQHQGHTFAPWRTLGELASQLAALRPLRLAAATDGNHGRAVAHMARLLGLGARIFVPAGTAEARIRAIEGEGAEVIVVDGTYDDAVALSAAEAGPNCLVISDTSWPGYESVPRDVIEGYATIFAEVDDELARHDEPGPDLVAVQIGVGALAAAVVSHYRRDDRRPQSAEDRRLKIEDSNVSADEMLSSILEPLSSINSSLIGRRLSIVGVEPTRAACLLAAMRAGRIVDVPGPHDSIMAGLNAGRASLVAWPIVSTGIDLFAAVEDERAREAMRALADAGVVAGETGAAGLAGLLELLTGDDAEPVRSRLGVTGATRALIFVTEGATDPDAYARIVIEN